MKLSQSVLISLIGSIATASAADSDVRVEKRMVQYVTKVTTVQIPLADYLAGKKTAQQAATTQAATTAAAVAASTQSKSKGGLLGFLEGLFDNDDSQSSTSTTSSANNGGGLFGSPTTTSAVGTNVVGTSTLSTASSSSDSPLFPIFTASSSSDITSPSSSSDSGSDSEGSFANNIAAAKGAKGITYSPYTKSGSCKTASEVKSDIAKLSSFSLIRLYSTDCNGIENILASMTSSQELFLGIYEIDTNTITSGLETIKSAVEATTRGWSAVHTISIGNERVNDGKSSVSDLATAIKTARSWLSTNASDYTGYVVTVDTLVATVSNPGLCKISDYLAVNAHPYWDGGVVPSNSGSWLQQQISNLESACGSSNILITETGWPTQGNTYGSCVPSISNQLAAIKSIMSKFSDQVFMFTMYNDYWKDPGSENVEQHWGIFGDPSA
ncbi:uncharacterized protein AC631_04327 [Debaryomyces fabryi]|uniref:Uncharacterized protein n=1 Tax=Debaryomyces fabryi TaxID=58627 RepID=A0A0V1PUQ8_9ASCO|nr:uncharacterized protein AC631_04327 [Debaryomyces fabryi]KRZ99919.1 hypothetical protein AC631_04327 [Debaryomyces fabryi]CUM51962.1 unnamed protein product [Debaryomyces fabryi]